MPNRSWKPTVSKFEAPSGGSVDTVLHLEFSVPTHTLLISVMATIEGLVGLELTGTVNSMTEQEDGAINGAMLFYSDGIQTLYLKYDILTIRDAATPLFYLNADLRGVETIGTPAVFKLYTPIQASNLLYTPKPVLVTE